MVLSKLSLASLRILLLALCVWPSSGDEEGLRGLTMPADDPPCAFACTGSLAGFALACSIEDHSHHGGGHGHGSPIQTSPSCRANDEPYLTTVAWCMSTKCAEYNVPNSRLEQVWELTITGDPSIPAKWSYTEALLNVDEPPTRKLTMGDELNMTSLPPDSWLVSFNTASVMDHESRTQSIYGLVLLLAGIIVPILLTWLGYLPFASTLNDRFIRPRIVYPSLVGSFQVRPLPYYLGNAPTWGQTLFIIMMLILNIITTATGYRTVSSHMWLRNQWQQIVGFMMYRTGVLSYALAPLVMLFAGRNNLLLWLTNWSHSTYLLLHRWMARLFMLQALLHSVLAVILYKDMGIYDAQAVMDYWAWGVVATVLGCVVLVVSTLYFRQRWYELFLLFHIAMAVLILVGCWYHAALRFPSTGQGFNTWIYIAVAVWVFDRVARLARIVKNGVRRARVLDLGNGYLRIDIDGVRWGHAPGRHVYVHLPALSPLRPWESHPFSILPRSLLRPLKANSPSPPSSHHDAEKLATTETIVSANSDTKAAAGIVLFVRKAEGITKSLKASSSLVTFLDGPYPNNSVSSLLRCDRVVLIAGGIGITGVLAWVDNHTNVKLFWGVKESAQPLVAALGPVIGRLDETNAEVRIGQRFNVQQLLEEEVKAGWAKIGVVVCGPGGLCDDVRASVVALGKQHDGTGFVLEVEAYTW
ncbi:Ferric/cupric reductase transmembrane component 1 [Triangularia verruculosa]|uniref:Ferric/cupric reductase transmembrane component 1 n=1 Tax=Triangularia verruculosa TaxID=2587418 RepID=A0AAN7AWP1_9PEZI|nr:Ferric/cupric reductase transmembrane component 1 [Triangularia verruculosa]